MRFPKLNRKQKIARNFLLIALALLLFEWLLHFPALTKEGVLRRAERDYLLENSALLFIGREEGLSHFREGTLYARNGDLLLAVNYDRTALGLQAGFSEIYDEPDGILCLSRDIHWDGSSGGREWDTQRTYTAEGQRKNEYSFTFHLAPYYAEADNSPEAEMERSFFDGGGPNFAQTPVLRLYDAEGTLLHEKSMDYIEWENFLHW